MSNFIKVNKVFFDKNTETFFQSRPVIFNLNNIIKFEVFDTDLKVENKLLGKILFEIDTVKKNTFFPFYVVSEELENIYIGVKIENSSV